MEITKATAKATNLRISSQKLNLVAKSIRGKSIKRAIDNLTFSKKRIAKDVLKVLNSAIANAEKIGFKTEILAINPLDENLKVPVYFANFVLMDYGLGAVFGCPAHDQRDLDFAIKYNLNVLPVIKPTDKEEINIKK